MRQAAVYEEEEVAETGTELNLGMGTLIGIFFGLALVCGVFFGFGYMLGHRPPGPYVSSDPLSESPKQAAIPSAPKPSALVAEQPSDTSRVIVQSGAPAEAAPTPAKPESIAQQPAPTAKPVPPTPVNLPKPSATQKVATNSVPPPVTTQVAPASAGTIPAGVMMVQIAAVKNRSDAEALASALRKNGFSPTIRTESQDKLLHVQLGPFSNRDDAKSMRQRLSSAGYDAFIK